MRLIDADNTIHALEIFADIEHGNHHFMYGIESAKEIVTECETIDAVPVVRGEWTSLTECSNEGVYCSVCHKKVWKADYAICTKTNKIRSNYCPNCGAKMESEGD